MRKTRQTKDGLVPFSVLVPHVAYLRIRQEARRRKVSISKLFTELITAGVAARFYGARDMRLEKYGFSYDKVDWDNQEQGMGVMLAEFVMRVLPPSRRELQ